MFEKNRFGKVGEQLHYKFSKDGSVQFLAEEQSSSFIKGDFEWKDAREIVTQIFVETLKQELKEVVAAGIPIPQLKFEGSNKEEFASPNFHFKTNVHAHFPEIPYCTPNTMFVDISFSKWEFRESNVEELKETYKLAPFIKHFPEFQTGKQLFLLEIMVMVAQSITLEKNLKSAKFLKTLKKIVARY